jgi:FkbM family methyltransferase
MPSVSSLVKDIWLHPANRGKRLTALLKAVNWQIYKRLYWRSLDIPVYNMILRIYPDSHGASPVLYFNGFPDFHEMMFMKHYLKSGDAFIDVGANVGVYTLLAASLVRSNGSIDAFEPNLKALERLRENIFLNKLSWVRVHSSAVGSNSSAAPFLNLSEDTCSRLLTGGETLSHTIKVPCVSLDQVLVGSYAMGKMDIEGAEPLALKGAERLLSESNPPVWQLELAGYSKRYGYHTHEIIEWLDARGYETALYDSSTQELKFTQEPWKYGAQNVLAVAQDSKEWVIERIRKPSHSIRAHI